MRKFVTFVVVWVFLAQVAIFGTAKACIRTDSDKVFDFCNRIFRAYGAEGDQVVQDIAWQWIEEGQGDIRKTLYFSNFADNWYQVNGENFAQVKEPEDRWFLCEDSTLDRFEQNMTIAEALGKWFPNHKILGISEKHYFLRFEGILYDVEGSEYGDTVRLSIADKNDQINFVTAWRGELLISTSIDTARFYYHPKVINESCDWVPYFEVDVQRGAWQEEIREGVEEFTKNYDGLYYSPTSRESIGAVGELYTFYDGHKGEYFEIIDGQVCRREEPEVIIKIEGENKILINFKENGLFEDFDGAAVRKYLKNKTNFDITEISQLDDVFFVKGYKNGAWFEGRFFDDVYYYSLEVNLSQSIPEFLSNFVTLEDFETGSVVFDVWGSIDLRAMFFNDHDELIIEFYREV